VVELLLEYGADPTRNIEIDGGPLAIVCGEGNLDMAKLLLSHGADPNLFHKGNQLPLYNAVITGNLGMIDLLLEHGADRTISDGDVFSCAEAKIIPRLLDAEILPAEKMKYLDICLQRAAFSTKLSLCSWLLDQGADLNYAGGEFGSPLQAALSGEWVSTAAIINDRHLIIEMFLRRGAKVNNPDPDGKFPSALQAAAATIGKGQYKTATRLLDAGADVNICGGKYHSPLQSAARFRPALLERLLQSGADINAVGGNFGSALHAAAYAHDLKSTKLLINHGADVNIIAGKYGSVIQAAAKGNSDSEVGFTSERESVKIIKLLHEHGASLTVQGGKYCTALQMAAKSGNLQAVKWLLANGADLNVEGGMYGSAYKAAVKKSQYAVISYLEQHFPGCK